MVDRAIPLENMPAVAGIENMPFNSLSFPIHCHHLNTGQIRMLENDRYLAEGIAHCPGWQIQLLLLTLYVPVS